MSQHLIGSAVNAKTFSLNFTQLLRMVIAMAFSDEIKKWRYHSGKTQKETADFFGVSMRTYQGWEQGDNEPGAAVCINCVRTKMADAAKSFPVSTDHQTNPATP